ncbi:hypothetical protein Tco_1292160 [Tanacetum coccineum]
MPPRMTTQRVGRATAAPRGGRTGGRTGRGGGRTRGQSGDQGNGGIDGQGGKVGGQGTEVNVGVDEVLDFSTIIAQQLQNLLSSSRQPRKGGAIVYTRWIEKMESVQDMSGCEENQKKLETEFWNYAIVRVGHVAYTDKFHELARDGGSNEADNNSEGCAEV